MASIATYKEDFDKVCAAIDRAYQHGEKITYKDNEQLCRLISRVGVIF